MPHGSDAMHDDAKTAAVKMSVGAGGALLSGLTLNEWVAVATLIYVVMQIGLLVPKYWRMAMAIMRGEDPGGVE